MKCLISSFLHFIHNTANNSEFWQWWKQERKKPQTDQGGSKKNPSTINTGIYSTSWGIKLRSGSQMRESRSEVKSVRYVKYSSSESLCEECGDFSHF